MTDSILDGLEPADVKRVLAAGRALTLPQGWSPIAERTPADKAKAWADLCLAMDIVDGVSRT